MHLASIIIGIMIGCYGAYMVRLVNKYKGKPKVSYIRFMATCSVAVIGPLGIYILRTVLGGGGDLPLSVSLVFSASIILSFVFSFGFTEE